MMAHVHDAVAVIRRQPIGVKVYAVDPVTGDMTPKPNATGTLADCFDEHDTEILEAHSELSKVGRYWTGFADRLFLIMLDRSQEPA
jgi:hypothetical protein